MTHVMMQLCMLCFRFHNAADEKVIGRNVVTPICDDVQLSVDEYRTKLYDVSGFLQLNLCFIWAELMN